MEYHSRKFTGISFLLRCGHHTATVKAPVHSRCNPNLFVCSGFSINRHFGIGWFIVEQKSFDCNSGIIYLFAGDFFKLITDLTAVSVDTVTNAVNKTVRFTFHRNRRQVMQMLGDWKWITFLCIT